MTPTTLLLKRSTTSPLLRVTAEGLLVLLGYVTLTVLLLHPLFSDPAHKVVDPFGNWGGRWLVAPDVNLVMWVMSWDWHALTTDPLRLFDANIFHPAPQTLACSEHMLGHLPIFGPVYWLSGNPVLANQMNILLSVSLCGTNMYALLRHWGVRPAAALFGGFIYAFCPVRIHLAGPGHAHLMAGQYLPLALLFLDRTLTKATLRNATGLAISLMLQMLCSYYLAYMTMVAMTAYGAGVLWTTRGRLRMRGVLLTALAVLAVLAFFLTVSLPYAQVREIGIIPDYSPSWAKTKSVGLWRNYLYPPAAIIEWGWRITQGRSLYVGVLPLTFVLIALMPGHLEKQVRCRWALMGAFGITLTCYLMALGPEISVGGHTIPLPYAAAMRYVPGFASLRALSRWGLVLMTGFAALAALGLARVLDRIGPVWSQRWLVPSAALALLISGTAFEYGLFSYRYSTRPVQIGAELPTVYRVLAEAPTGAVLEIPIGTGGLPGLTAQSEYMFYSTFHWHPLLNGYSGYWPPSYSPVMSLARSLPNVRGTRLLTRATGLRYVVVHLARLKTYQHRMWDDPAGLQQIGRFGQDLLFEVTEALPPDLMPALIDFSPRSTTILGTPLAALPEGAKHAELSLSGVPPASVAPGLFLELGLIVTNRSEMVWPALVSVGPHLVTLAYRWEGPQGRVVAMAAARLPYDLKPGESVNVRMDVLGPRQLGASHLVIGLAQDGKWFPGPHLSIPIAVRPLRILK